MSAYLLKWALNGYCVKLNLKELKEVVLMLRICSDNLNQYTKRAHETNQIYYRDIADVKARLEKIQKKSDMLLKQLRKSVTE